VKLCQAVMVAEKV